MAITNVSGDDYHNGCTTVTAGSTANSKASSYTELMAGAAVTDDVWGFKITFDGSGSSGSSTNMLIDIGIGAASSETVLIPEIMCGWQESFVGHLNLWIPIFIASGTRISANAQGENGASDDVDVGIILNYDKDVVGPIYENCDVIGEDTANSRGTAVTTGSNGFGSMTDIPSSTNTSRDYDAFMPLVVGENDTAYQNENIQWKLGYDSGGGDVEYDPIYYNRTGSAEEHYMTICSGDGIIHEALSSGAQMRMKVSQSSTGDVMYATVHGFYGVKDKGGGGSGGGMKLAGRGGLAG